MKLLPPQLALVFGRLAHLLGDLWTVQSRLTAAATGIVELPSLLEGSRSLSADLSSVRDQLAELVAGLPAPPADLWDPWGEIELRLPELVRARLECLWVDRLEPAIAALDATSNIVPTPTSPPVIAQVPGGEAQNDTHHSPPESCSKTPDSLELLGLLTRIAAQHDAAPSEIARADLRCVLTDCLDPIIADLTDLLALPSEAPRDVEGS